MDRVLWTSQGSGYSMTKSEVGEMPWPELKWWAHRVDENRRLEAEAWRKSTRR